jgi:acyl-homoserine-lactone acylase
MLLANPHYPWFSTDRFYQMHMTIPGVYDAMGASLGALPIVVIGFNRDVAWAHTVTKAAHFSTFRLQLDSRDPSRNTYLLDGVPMPITQRAVDVQLLQADGTLRVRRKLFRETPLGMAIAVADLPIGPDGLLVLGDPNRSHTRLIEQWIAIGKAGSAEALRAAMARVMGLAWVNTVAADRYGTALFVDYSVVPHVTNEQFAAGCLLFAPLLMLDGSRTACLWGSDSGAPPGIFGSANAPAMTRRDYVANSNDSYWLTNARQLLAGPGAGYSPLYGAVAVPQHLRTRLGFVQIEEKLAQLGKLNRDDLAALLFSNRVHAAELVLPELLPACAASADDATRQACAVLSAWDRKVDLDSRGGILFREFWQRAKDTSGMWAVPFDPADPVHTPRGLAPTAMTPLLAALRDAADRLRDLGISLDARTGDYQKHEVPGVSAPLHGGVGDVDGVYNALHMASGLTPAGYGRAMWGASYVQIVGFSDRGPVASGVLVYGQSTDPKSAHYADQLALYANKQLVALPFTEQEIADDRGRERTILSLR